MKSLIIFLFVIFTALIITETRIVKHRAQEDELRSGIRTLKAIPIGVTTEIIARASNGRSWRYVKSDSAWRYPDYHSAYIQPRRIKHVLNSLTKATASIVSTEPGLLQHYQLLPNSPIITLSNKNGETLLNVRLGRGAPDASANESYVQLVDADTIYHLHANAAHAFDAGDPPMIDRHVWPRVIKSQPFERVVFDSSHEVRALYRQLDNSNIPEVQQGIPQIPNYIWRIDLENGSHNCLSENAFAYTAFLHRLKWTQLHDDKLNSVEFKNARTITLHTATGKIDTLEIVSNKTKHHLLRLRTTGQVFSITDQKALLLYPNKNTLTDSLPIPNPYEKIEPQTSF